MSIWFLIWFILAAIILGTTLWSTIILIQQKQAWKAYAEKKGLTFTPNKFFEPCTLEGNVEGYEVSFFTAVQQKEDTRKNRQVTVAQLISKTPFIDSIAMGTKEMVLFLQSLDAVSVHDVKVPNWNKDFDIRSRNKEAVDAYLTEERVKILNSILSMPKSDVVILLSENEGVFRIETSNPLHDEKKVEALISKLIARVEKLKPDAAELKILKGLSKEPPIVTQENKP